MIPIILLAIFLVLLEYLYVEKALYKNIRSQFLASGTV